MSVKVGDKLVFRSGGMIDRVEIIPVEKITPSGRIYAGTYQLNPDLSIRGRRDAWHSPYQGELLTDDELAELEREQKEKRIRDNCVYKLREVNWRKVPTKTLIAVWNMVNQLESAE